MSCVVVLIAGGSCSGKSVLAQSLRRELQDESVSLLSEDAYFFDQETRSEEAHRLHDFDAPAAKDRQLLRDHILELVNGRAIPSVLFDFVNRRRVFPGTQVEPARVLIVEGLHVLLEPIGTLGDLKIFVDAPGHVRLARRIIRDVETRGRTIEFIVGQYLNSVAPRHLEFVEPQVALAHEVIATHRPESSESARNQVLTSLVDRIRELRDQQSHS